MKKEALKELGKFSLDLAKIVFAVAILTPFLKTGNLDLRAIGSGFLLMINGVILINKGYVDG